VAISHEQRKKLGLPSQDAADQQQEQTSSLEKIEEGQEISPDAAERLQPQMGNLAVQALLAQTQSSTQTSTGTADFELAEEIQEQGEEYEGGSLDVGDVSFGGGSGDGGGGGGVPVDMNPWEVQHLFGGDDDDTPKKPTPKKPRRALPQQRSTADLGTGLSTDDERLPDEEMNHIEESLGTTPVMKEEYRAGDSRYRAIEFGLQTPHAIGRRKLIPESMIDRTDHLDPIGRATAIGRFLSNNATEENARAIARLTGAPVAILLTPSTGHAGAAARLATLTVCAEAQEGGAMHSDRAVAVSLCRDVWGHALESARKVAATGRVVAPHIVEAAGEIMDESEEQPKFHMTNEAMAAVRLGTQALDAIIPIPIIPEIPSLNFAEAPALITENTAIAAADAALASFTGAPSAAELPNERILDSTTLQPVLDAATALVNAMGRAQVEFAAATIALKRVRPSAQSLSTLKHADKALRQLARTVVLHGDKLHRARGMPAAATGELTQTAILSMRQSAQSLSSLRHWVFSSIAEALCK
jgi:hypothetical protein